MKLNIGDLWIWKNRNQYGKREPKDWWIAIVTGFTDESRKNFTAEQLPMSQAFRVEWVFGGPQESEVYLLKYVDGWVKEGQCTFNERI